MAKSMKNHDLMKQAHREVTNALNNGLLTRQACALCGSVTTQAHHYDYSKPLDVKWLCNHHHGLVHSWEGFSPRTKSADKEPEPNYKGEYTFQALLPKADAMYIHNLAKEINVSRYRLVGNIVSSAIKNGVIISQIKERGIK